jgi:hypothetical protein
MPSDLWLRVVSRIECGANCVISFGMLVLVRACPR